MYCVVLLLSPSEISWSTIIVRLLLLRSFVRSLALLLWVNASFSSRSLRLNGLTRKRYRASVSGYCTFEHDDLPCLIFALLLLLLLLGDSQGETATTTTRSRGRGRVNIVAKVETTIPKAKTRHQSGRRRRRAKQLYWKYLLVDTAMQNTRWQRLPAAFDFSLKGIEKRKMRELGWAGEEEEEKPQEINTPESPSVWQLRQFIRFLFRGK